METLTHAAHLATAIAQHDALIAKIDSIQAGIERAERLVEKATADLRESKA
tara:strand:+ start:1360 stop:1512 length:153 start_codon:yes stop_codon:yes gene_type:complete